MLLEEIEDSRLETIVGGENFSVEGMMALLSVLAILVSIYKLYVSTKGKTKIGNSYSFEWS